MGCMPLSMARSPLVEIRDLAVSFDGAQALRCISLSKVYLRKALEASLRALEVDVIDLYQWHRPDRWKVYGEVVQHFADFQAEGLVKATDLEERVGSV